mgnify:CR=1 FL=1
MHWQARPCERSQKQSGSNAHRPGFAAFLPVVILESACATRLAWFARGAATGRCRCVQQQPSLRETMERTTRPWRLQVKPYDIDVQRLHSMRHDKGLIEVSIDALVMTRSLRDDQAAGTCLRLPVEHARTLLILLKQQIAELDKLQPRSRRSGRA